MSAPQQFPAFLSIEYDGRGDGFPAFERAAGAAFNRVEGRMRQFTANFEEVGRVAAKAIAGGLSGAGGLDLNVGQFRQAAAEARLYESVMRELQQSTTALAAKTGDTSQATRSYIQAIGAQVVEARQASAQAEAQVTSYTRLQAALDGVADRNSVLAASYREVYAEQARAAQAEVSQRQIQSAYNSTFAPGLTRSASTNGAGFGALEEMLKRRDALVTELNANVAELENRFEREASASAAAAERARAALAAQNEELRRQAQLLAEQAREQANVKANNDRFTLGPRAIDNGAGFGALAAELDRVEQAEREAAAAAKLYEQALFEIRQQVDPAYFAQKRFNQELAFADHALKSGDITADQYAKRLAFLRGEMALNAASTRQMRFASVQLGQQLQDVVIQAQMGTNAFVILAQQGSQMAFALTEVEGKVGAVARAMAGWQGAIVFAGIALVGQLIPALISGSQRAKELDDALGKVKFSTDAVQSAQGILGNVMDITTGKISTQRQELLDLAKAQLLVAQLQARARADAARGQVNDLTNSTTEFGGGFGGGLSIGRRPAGRRGEIANDFLSGKITANDAIDGMKRLQENGLITKEVFAEASAAIANFNLETANIKSLEAAERLLSGKGTAADRKLLLKPKNDNGSAAREATRLAERGEDAAKKIANITDRFSDIPPQVRAVNTAMRELNDLANDFSTKQPPNYEQIVINIAKAKKALRETALDIPVNDLLDAQKQQLVISDLQARGRVVEATSLQQILTLERQRGPLSQAQKDAIVDANFALREQSRELERQMLYQRNLLNYVQAQRDTVNDLVYNLLSGKGLSSVGGFVKSVFNSYLRALSDEITNNLTAAFFQKQSDRIRGERYLSDAGKRMAGSVDELKKALDSLTQSVNSAAGSIGGASSGADTPANDNDITVTAKKLPKSVNEAMKDGLKEIGKSIFGEKAATQFGEIASKGMRGAAIGTATAGILKSLGIKQSTTGAQIGGAIGSFIPIPGGEIIGSIIGGTIGGLLKKTKWGAVTLSGSGASEGFGNSGGAIGAAVQAGGAFDSQLRKIADALGGKIGDFGNITIGQRHGDWRVNTGGTSLKVKKGATDFNEDAEAAIAYAISVALERGAITGIRNSTNNLLKAAGDMEEKLSKALSFESVFRELAKIKNPVGSAISDLNLEFKKMIDIFKEAGATSEETAQLEELYQIKRKSVTEEAMKSLTGSLNDLYKNLTTGDNGYSLRTRLSNAKADYDPLAARVAAGDSTAYNDFANAAQTLIELQREYSGSAPEYFAVLDQVKQLSKGELDRQQALFNTASGAASPFDTQPIVDATQQQTNAIVSALATQNQAANDNAARQRQILENIQLALTSVGTRSALFGKLVNF